MQPSDLSDYESHVLVRALRIEDFDDLISMQRRCFPGMPTWGLENIQNQLARFPQGQLVVEYDDKIVASSGSLVIEIDEYGSEHDWREISDHGNIGTHDPEGDTLYGIEIMVDPDYRGMRLSRRLYDARKELSRELNLKRIVVGGRLPGYRSYASEMTARQYVDRVMEKHLVDQVLTAQLANGFVLKRLISGYLDDHASGDWATLLEWANIDYHPAKQRHMLASNPVRLCVVQYQMRSIANFDEFAQQVTYFVDVASGYNSDFVLFPELFTTQMLSFVEEKRPALAVRALSEYTEAYVELCSALAVKHNVNIIGGTHLTVEDEHLYNIAWLFRRDGTIDKQYKLHITPNESRWWGVQPGKQMRTFDTDRGKIAILVCYDSEFPELARIAVANGARILFVPFCTDARQGYVRVRACSQARAIENQVYVAIAGTVGNLPHVENMDIQYAQSAIFTPSDIPFPSGAVAAECTENIETVVVQDIDLATLERNRLGGAVRPWAQRRLDLYEVVYKGQ